MSINTYGLEFIYDKSTQTDFIDDQGPAIVAPTDSCIIPNQLWQGYWKEDIFNANKPAGVDIQFMDFGVSIRQYACAVCCCVGVVNLFKNTNYTIKNFYDRNYFIWYKDQYNKNGLHNGVTLARFSYTKKLGVDTTQTLHIAYDVGRDYGWCKNSKNYTNTSSIIIPEKITAYASKFYQPQSGETTKGYKDNNKYNQAGGAYTKGSLSDIFASTTYALNYRAAQAQAIERIKQDINNGHADILYINSPVTKSGHYVLAVEAIQNYSTHSYADIVVWDPCPTNQTGYNNKTSYYGRKMTLMQSMNRIKGDISDGIRTIQTCSTI